MIYAPVIIITCNRYEHLERCIDSLRKNTYAEQTELYISVDYPPNEEYREGWEKVCQLLHRPIEGFGGVNLYFQEANLGVYENYQFLRREAFAKYDRLIYTEDDNEFSPNFLAYIDRGLELYENHPKVYAICGYANDYPFEYGGDNVIALTDGCEWGMGIWREKEKTVEEQLTVRNWMQAARNVRLMRRLYRNRSRLFSRMLGALVDQKEEEAVLNIDVNRGIFMALNGFCSINPVQTKVRNWGFDGSGQNIIGDSEEHVQHVGQQLDTDRDFEYRLEKVEVNHDNDRLLDDNDSWNRARAKWYCDPLMYCAYRLLGRKLFLRLTHRG